MVTYNLLQLADDTCNVKQTDFVEETQISSQIDDFTYCDTERIVASETKVTPRINKQTHTPIPGKAEIESLQDFQKNSNYMFKVNNRNIRARYEICSNLTIKTPERRLCRRSGVFIVNF